MMKKKSSIDNEFLDLILCAIGNAIMSGDTVVGFNGIQYFWEDVEGQDRSGGYLIKHSDYPHENELEDIDNSEDTDEFQNWLTAELYYHANKCLAHFDEQIRNN